MIVENAQGQMVDLNTGEIVGVQEGTPTTARAQTPAIGDSYKAGDETTTLLGTNVTLPAQALSLVRQASWAWNRALFELPDAAVAAVAKKVGVQEDNIPSFVKLFNRGETAPTNSAERYTRAIAKGIGETAPITGALAYVAKSLPLLRQAAPNAGIVKNIATDTIRFIQQHPVKATAMDLLFGGAYEGLKQAVRENVSDDNPNKKLLEDLMPASALVGGPLALSKILAMSPTLKLAQFTGDKVKELNASLGDVEKQVLGELTPSLWRFPIVNVFPKMVIKRAEANLSKGLGEIANSKEAQEALDFYKNLMNDPDFAESGFKFGLSQQTLSPPLLAKESQLLERSTPGQMQEYIQRSNENRQKWQALYDRFSPETQTQVQSAFDAVRQERQAFMDNLVRQEEGLTEMEIANIAERLGPQNIDMLNDEIRGALLARNEMSNQKRIQALKDLGVDQALHSDGTLAGTRDRGTMQSLPQYPTVDIESPLKALLVKYTPARPSTKVQLPEPISLLRRFAAEKERLANEVRESSRDTLFNDTINSAIKNNPDLLDALSQQKRGQGMHLKTVSQVDPSEQLMNLAKLFMKRAVDPKSLTKKELSIIEEELRVGPKIGAGIAKDGTVSLSVGMDPKTKLRFNPKQIIDDAELMAAETGKLDMNVPEAFDYLQAALRARNNSVVEYNKALKSGRDPSDAQRILDRGKAVYDDIERLVLDNVPKIDKNYDQIRQVTQAYRDEFQKFTPLTLAERSGTQEYLLGNEQALRQAFKSGESLRQLSKALGSGPESDEMIMKGAIDWLRSKRIFSPEGTVDPRKIRSVLDNSPNIVEALPASVQGKLRREVDLADDYVARMGEINDRKILAQDNELQAVLTRAARPGADPDVVIKSALTDPATMTTLVRGMGKDPDKINALRRAVFDFAAGNVEKGAALESFLQNNRKSLEVLFKNTRHLDDLSKLANLQKRIELFSGVTGQVPVFEASDAQMQRIFGVGIKSLTTTMREIGVGRISAMGGTLGLMIRLGSALETQVYDKLFVRAIENEDFAHKLVNLSTPEQAAQVAKELEGIGVPIQRVLRMAALEGRPESNPELPIEGSQNAKVIPKETAREMMRRSLPPAPKARGLEQARPEQRMRMEGFMPADAVPKTATSSGQTGSSLAQSYMTMFPDDPLSKMLAQRQAQQPPAAAPQ